MCSNALHDMTVTEMNVVRFVGIESFLIRHSSLVQNKHIAN